MDEQNGMPAEEPTTDAPVEGGDVTAPEGGEAAEGAEGEAPAAPAGEEPTV